MTTQYTPILQLALPVTGELNGTWGDVVNNNITSMVEEAIAGLATINTWTANAHTLTTANGTTDEARCAMLVAATGSGGTALSAAGEIICPARTKLFVLQNNAAYQVTLKTASGTGIAVAAGDTAFLFCDGTNVNACVTQIINGHITGNLTVDGNATVNGNTTLGNATSDTITATARIASDLNPSADNTYDLGTAGNSWRNLYIDGTATIATLNVTTIDTTNLEVTNIKAKDGTAAITLADSTGVATLSANPILSGGTANGVAYLNGSKVLTTGSALTFDGTNINVGAGGFVTATSGGTVNAGLVSVRSQLGTHQVGTAVLQYGGNEGAIRVYGGTGSMGQLVFNLGAGGSADAEYMRLTSTGLGIGTSSPAYKLDVSGVVSWLPGVAGNPRGFLSGASADQSIEIGTSTNSPLGFATNGTRRLTLDSSGNLGLGTSSPASGVSSTQAVLEIANGNVAALSLNNTASRKYTIYSTVSGELSFYDVTAGAARLKLDSSGNLGLGVAPSAWSSASTPAFQLKNGAALYSRSTSTHLAQNFFYNSSDAGTYINNGYVTLYAQNSTNGQHQWFNAPSGTAGSTASLTQAMTLDASGNLLVGGTSSLSSSAGRTDFTLNGSSSGGIISFGTGGVRKGYLYQDSSDFSIANEVAGNIRFLNNGAERARIDSSGNVGIGTSSSLQKLTIQDGNILLRQGSTDGQNQIAFSNGYGRRQGITFVSDGSVSNTSFGIVNTQTALIFQTAAYNIAVNSDLSTGWTERMRLDSSGNLGLGVTPSAWGGGFKAMQYIGGSVSSQASGYLYTSQNAYYNGTSWTYSANGGAVQYEQSNAQHQWKVAGYGTAGNAITFTQAMTLDANSALTVRGTCDFSTANTTCRISSNATSIFVGDNTIGYGTGYGIGSSSAYLYFQTYGSERMRIDSAGNVGIGTSSPANKLDVVGGSGRILVKSTNTAANADIRYTATNADWVVGVNSVSGTGEFTWYNVAAVAERMRLDSSGNLGLGVTPQTWFTQRTALQIGTNGSVFSNTAYYPYGTYLAANVYLDSTDTPKYISSSGASFIVANTHTNGNVRMYCADAGTAGATASFTQVFEVAKGTSIALEGATRQAGTGITFPATQSASSNANTLDDYEEGTFTPSISPQGGSLTSYTSSAKYTKVGNLVTVNILFTITNPGTATGVATASNLPFTTSNAGASGVCREIQNTGYIYNIFAGNAVTSSQIASLTNGAITWTTNYVYSASFTYFTST